MKNYLLLSTLFLAGCGGGPITQQAKPPVPTAPAPAAIQYDVSLYVTPGSQPIGHISVDVNGVVKTSLDSPTITFCPAPDYDCFPVTGKFPSGSWAGDFHVDGAKTDIPLGTDGVYLSALQPQSTVNGHGSLPNPNNFAQ